MKAQHLIAANDFCVYHQVEYTFITSLQKAGLVEVTLINEKTYIPESELQKLEKMIRLHNELEINIPGIEAITHLLDRIEHLQADTQTLKNRLRMYEAD
ncbi:MAG TPA: chaperone modulator CbpM [Mucilaginibacter sp.]